MLFLLILSFIALNTSQQCSTTNRSSCAFAVPCVDGICRATQCQNDENCPFMTAQEKCIQSAICERNICLFYPCSAIGELCDEQSGCVKCVNDSQCPQENPSNICDIASCLPSGRCVFESCGDARRFVCVAGVGCLSKRPVGEGKFCLSDIQCIAPLFCLDDLCRTPGCNRSTDCPQQDVSIRNRRCLNPTCLLETGKCAYQSCNASGLACLANTNACDSDLVVGEPGPLPSSRDEDKSVIWGIAAFIGIVLIIIFIVTLQRTHVIKKRETT